MCAGAGAGELSPVNPQQVLRAEVSEREVEYGVEGACKEGTEGNRGCY